MSLKLIPTPTTFEIREYQKEHSIGLMDAKKQCFRVWRLAQLDACKEALKPESSVDPKEVLAVLISIMENSDTI